MKRGKTITKKDFAESLAEKFGIQQQTMKDMLQYALDHIVIEIGKGHRFEFRDFGVLEPLWRKSRKAQNPKTLAPVLVPGRRIAKFKEGRLMRSALDGKASGGNQAPSGSPAQRDSAEIRPELKLVRGPKKSAAASNAGNGKRSSLPGATLASSRARHT